MMTDEELAEIRAADAPDMDLQTSPPSWRHRRLLISALDETDSDIATLAELLDLPPSLSEMIAIVRERKADHLQRSEVETELHSPFHQAVDEAPGTWVCEHETLHMTGCPCECAEHGSQIRRYGSGPR